MTHMRKVLAVVGGIVVVITALLTSTSLKEFTMSAERKINAAVPPSEKLRLTKTAVFETASASQWNSIEEELETRMKIRALRCAKGYAPSFYVRVKAVQKNLTDQSCFNEADQEIAQWLALRRVGVILSKPAFTPVPSTLPPYIVADASIQNLSFAENAGVVLLETPSSIQIVNIETQKPILREMKGGSIPGRISANGRLFVTGEGSRLKIRDAESGSIIAELNDIPLKTFYWLDETSALYNKRDSEKTFIMDFVGGKEIPVQAINKKLSSVARLGQTTNQFTAFSTNSITKIELVRTQGGLEVKLRDEKQDPSFASRENVSGVNSNGNYFFNVGRQIHIVSLSTLTAYSVPLESFHARFAVATADPDKLLLIGSQASAEKKESGNLLYSISERSLTPLPNLRIATQRCVYANALRREAIISDNKIALADIFVGTKFDVAKHETASQAASAASPPKTEKTEIAKDKKTAPSSAAAADGKASIKTKAPKASTPMADNAPKPSSSTAATAPPSPASNKAKETPSDPKKNPESLPTMPKKMDLSQTT